VQGGNTFEARIGGFHGGARLRKILVAGEVYRDPQFGSDGRLHYPENGSGTANAHAFSQGDLRGHEEGEFYILTRGDGKIGEEKAAPSTEVLGEAACLKLAAGQLHADRNVEFETLPDATL